MRILFWSPNYAPELTGIPPLVTDACRFLAARGHEVEVVTGMPNYPERVIHDGYRRALWRTEHVEGVTLRRSWLRVRPRESFLDKALYETTFTAASLPLAAARLRRADVVVCVVPTLLSAAAAALLPTRRLVVWMQNLVLSGALAVDGIGPRTQRVIELVRGLERWTTRQADGIVVCSPGFRDYLIGRDVDPARIETILNWVDVDEVTPVPPSRNGRTRFLCAGNLGYSQGFETLVDAARLVPGARVTIAGDGNAADAVRRLAAATENVEVRPPCRARTSRRCSARPMRTW